jgi:hypothetical protein
LGGDLRVALFERLLGDADCLGPHLVLVELILATELSVEVRKQLGRALLRRRFENFLALADEALQILTLRFVDGVGGRADERALHAGLLLCGQFVGLRK